jgi:hypothetical protein
MACAGITRRSERADRGREAQACLAAMRVRVPIGGRGQAKAGIARDMLPLL